MSPSLKVWLGRAFTALCALITAASAYNVFGDNAEVEALARRAAGCDKGCQLARIERSPIAQSFELARGGGKIVAVRCTRAAVLVGDYACEAR